MANGIKTGGRKKGTPNKLNATVKEMILGALDKAGGQKWLEKQATENPVAFMTLLGKVLPMTLVGDKHADPIQVQPEYPKLDWEAVWRRAGLQIEESTYCAK